MEFIDFFAGENDDGRTLEKILRKMMPNLTLSGIYKGIRTGLVKVNQAKVPKNCRVHSGDKISIAKFLLDDTDAQIIPKKKYATPQVFPQIETIFLSDDVRIINKPYGIPTQGGGKSSVNCAEIVSSISSSSFSSDSKNNSLAFSTGPLHRLDTNTTGILVFSNSIKGAKFFAELMKAREIKKTYLAILEGKVEKDLMLKDKLIKTEGVGYVKAKVSDTPDARLAITSVFPITYGEFDGLLFTFAKIAIETGVYHQIRAQCSHAGFPLLGDVAYGGKPILLQGEKVSRHFLHAWKMEVSLSKNITDFDFPTKIQCALPKEFIIFLKKFLRDFDIKSYNNTSYETN